jgi:hypothetical protein
MKKLLLIFLTFVGIAAAQHSNTLTWTWSQGSGDSATGFDIQRSTSNTGPFTTIGTNVVTVLTYVDTNVTAGQIWYYQILAFNSGGTSLPSNIVSATTPFSVSNPPSALSVVSK